jgi:WD40 repeat protein
MLTVAQFKLISTPDVKIVLIDGKTPDTTLNLSKKILEQSAVLDNMFKWQKDQSLYTLFVDDIDIMTEVLLSLYGVNDRIFVGSNWEHVSKTIMARDYLTLSNDASLLYDIEVPISEFNILIQVLSLFDIESDKMLQKTLLNNIPKDYDCSGLSVPMLDIINKSKLIIIAGTGDGKIFIWNLIFNRLEKIVGVKYDRGINRLLLSFDGKYLIYLCEKRSIRVYDTNTYKLVSNNGRFYKSIDNIELSRDNTKMLVSGEDYVWLMNFENFDLRNRVEIDSGDKDYIAIFSNDNTSIAIGNAKGKVKLYNTLTKQFQHLWEYPDSYFNNYRITCLSFSPNDKLLACGSANFDIKLWDIENSVCLHTLNAIIPRVKNNYDHYVCVMCFCFTSDSKFLFSAGKNICLNMWDVRTGDHIRTISHPDQREMRSYSAHIALSDDDKYLVATRDLQIDVWDTTTWEKINGFEGRISPQCPHSMYFSDVIFSRRTLGTKY